MEIYFQISFCVKSLLCLTYNTIYNRENFTLREKKKEANLEESWIWYEDTNSAK